MSGKERGPSGGAPGDGAAFAEPIVIDYRAMFEKVKAIEDPAGLPDIREVLKKLVARLEGIDDEFTSKWQAAAERKWTQDSIKALKDKIIAMEALLESPITVMEIPPEVLDPPVPEGLGEGWFREVPLSGGRVETFVRVLSEAETVSIHRSIYSRSDYPPKLPTIFEATLKLLGKNELMLKGDDLFWVRLHDNPYAKVKPRNRRFGEEAEKILGKDHPITRALSMEELTLRPGQAVKKMVVFPEGNFDKPLDALQVNKLYCGEWPLHRTVPMLYPPGMQLPAVTVLQLVLPRNAGVPLSAGETFDPWTDRKVEWGKTEGGAIVSAGVEVSLRVPPKDELVEFFSDEPVFIPDAVGIAYVKATCSVVGHMGIVGPEAITTVHRGGASGITNVLPSWDPRGAAPEIPSVPKPAIIWRAPMQEREPLIAVSGDRILVTTDDRALAILDSEGKVTTTLEVRGKVSALAGGPDCFLVAYGDELGVLEKDGRWKHACEVESNLISLALLPDGTVLAGSDPYHGGKMYIIDPEGKPAGEVDAPFSGNIIPMADGRLAALNGDRRPGILEAGGGVQMSTLASGVQGLAVSGDSKRLFLLGDSQCLSCYTLEKTRAPTENELSYPRMPDVPLAEKLWEARLPDMPERLAHLPERGLLASSVRLGFLYLHTEEGRLLWKGRFKGDSISALAAFPGGTRLLVATEEPALYCVDLAPVL